MTFFNISNAKRFFERILTCKGNVYSAENGKQAKDLKKTAEYFLSSGIAEHMGGIDRIDVRVEQPCDAANLMRYMAEASREQHRPALSRIA